jgi:hypothetical protein
MHDSACGDSSVFTVLHEQGVQFAGLFESLPHNRVVFDPIPIVTKRDCSGVKQGGEVGQLLARSPTSYCSDRTYLTESGLASSLQYQMNHVGMVDRGSGVGHARDERESSSRC